MKRIFCILICLALFTGCKKQMAQIPILEQEMVREAARTIPVSVESHGTQEIGSAYGVHLFVTISYAKAVFWTTPNGYVAVQ